MKKENSSMKKLYSKAVTYSVSKNISGNFKSAQGSFRTETEFQSCNSFKTPKRFSKYESLDGSFVVNTFKGNFYYLDDSYQFIKLA